MTTKICPVCHSPISAEAPGGFCPACLLRDAEDVPLSHRPAPSLTEVAAAFPKLEVLGLLGQGGMGVVYKVRQPALDRTIALKILLPELGRDPAFAERFAREARVLGKLNHPNIVTVFEHGESGGFYYLLMEFVDGVNLRQAMRAGRFTPVQALAIVPGICDALQAAHAQGVWHRDIKPENILLDPAGGVKIADFGIARIVGDPARDFTLTRTGGALGSAIYMAPEQHEKPHDVDHRADIYSLGVVIYEMLTGELPLGRFPAPSRRAEVSARIDEIVLRTLEKERELRQQSAGEVKTDVQGAAGIAASVAVSQAPADKGSYGKLAFGLFVIGLLGAPLLSGLIGGDEVMFLCGTALLLALVLGLMSWRERLAKFVVIATGVLAVIATLQYLNFRSTRHRVQAEMKQAMQEAMARETEPPADAIPAPKESARDWKLDAESLEKLSRVGESESWFPWGGFIKNGDAQRMRGDLAGALQNYRKSAAYIERKESPKHWRHFLVESHTKIGDVLSLQGNLAGALGSYQAGLAVYEEISKQDPPDPESAGMEDKLIAVHVKIGDIQSRQGNRTAALQSYRAGVAAAEHFPKGWENEYPVGKERSAPFNPDALTRLAAMTPEEYRDDEYSRNRQLMWLINRAGAEKDVRFRYLLDQDELRKDREVDLALAGYDYSVNGNTKALDYILTKLAAEEVGSDSSEVVALFFVDEWKRTTDAVESHFSATDGAGGDCHASFWGTRQTLFPRRYLEFRGKVGEGAPVPGKTQAGPSASPAPVLSAEEVFRQMNALANESNGEEFVKRLSTAKYPKGKPEGPVTWITNWFFGEIRYLKHGNEPADEIVAPGNVSTAILWAGIGKPDGKVEYREFAFVLEDGEWRYEGNYPPRYRPHCRIQFQPPHGNARTILRTHLDPNYTLIQVPGTEGQFDVVVSSSTVDAAVRISNSGVELLEKSLKSVGLGDSFKIISRTGKPEKPWLGEDVPPVKTPQR